MAREPGERLLEQDRWAPVMVPGATAAKIAGISPQRLWYWEHTDLIMPTYRREVSQRKIIRLYSLERLRELVIAAQLVREPGISLQHVRRLLSRLRKRYEAPLTQLRFSVVGPEVYFEDEYGTLEGSRHEGQTVMQYSVDLPAVDAVIRQAEFRRSNADSGRVEKRRHVRASEPVFRGTRIPVSAIFEFIHEGATDRDIRGEYPALRSADLKKARALYEVALRLLKGESWVRVRRAHPDLEDADWAAVKELARAA